MFLGTILTNYFSHYLSVKAPICVFAFVVHDQVQPTAIGMICGSKEWHLAILCRLVDTIFWEQRLVLDHSMQVGTITTLITTHSLQ
jgi:hypothetical protein